MNITDQNDTIMLEINSIKSQVKVAETLLNKLDKLQSEEDINFIVWKNTRYKRGSSFVTLLSTSY